MFGASSELASVMEFGFLHTNVCTDWQPPILLMISV